MKKEKRMSTSRGWWSGPFQLHHPQSNCLFLPLCSAPAPGSNYSMLFLSNYFYFSIDI